MTLAVDERHSPLQAMEIRKRIAPGIKHVQVELVASQVCAQGPWQQAHTVHEKYAGGGLLQARAIDRETGLDAHAWCQCAPGYIYPAPQRFPQKKWKKAH